MDTQQNEKSKHFLHTVNLCRDFVQGGKLQHVLRGITIDFQQGKSYAITGVSGSGKSTFLHLLGGLDFPTSGSVLVDGNDFRSLKLSEKNSILNQLFGFVFQFHYLIKELSILENVMLPGLIRRENKKKCRNRAQELLAMMKILDKEHAYPCTLSGGEQQRVAIARALFNKPAFLLADEPTGNLDADNAQTVVDLFFSAQREWGMGIILCSHDPAVYKKMEKVFRLSEGQIVVEQ